MPPSQNESQTCTDKCSDDLQLLMQEEIKLQGSIHAGTKSCFPQRAAAIPGACNTSLQKRYCSETSLVPKSLPSPASDGSYL